MLNGLGSTLFHTISSKNQYFFFFLAKTGKLFQSMFFFLPESVDYLHFLVSLGYVWSSDQILPLGMWQDQ